MTQKTTQYLVVGRGQDKMVILASKPSSHATGAIDDSIPLNELLDAFEKEFASEAPMQSVNLQYESAEQHYIRTRVA